MSKSRFLPKIACLSLCFFSFACSSTHSDKVLVKELELEIEESNKLMATYNENLLQSLVARSIDPKTKEKALLWLPKAQEISKISKEHLSYLENLKQSFSTINNQEEKGKGFDESSSRQLYQRISSYWKMILSFDSKLNNQLSEEIRTINAFPENDNSTASFLSKANSFEVTAFLSKIRGNVLRTENKCLMFCLDQTTYICDLEFEVFEALVGQNAKILRVGDDLEITAGLGAFRKSKSPIVTVGNKQVELNESGIAHYKTKTARKVGKYSLPVKFAFVNQDGKQVERIFDVEYILVDSIRIQ